MNYKYVILLLSVFLCCNDKDPQQMQFEKMGSLLKNCPDSAYVLLDSLLSSDDLSDASFAKSCLLISESADLLHKELLDIQDYERAKIWFCNNGTVQEQALINYYLGRSYVEDSKYENAMHAYLSALDLSENIKDKNTSGYIASYIADLYEIQNDPVNAQRYYKIASDNFCESNNLRSYALSLKDIARELAFQDSFVLALNNLRQADSLAYFLQDSIVSISICNSFGNVYRIMKQYDNAERYLLKAAAIDTTALGIPNLLALSDLNIETGCWGKAYYHLDQISRRDRENQYIDMLIYSKYKLCKAQKDYRSALSYLEQYQEILDSTFVSNEKLSLLEYEKKYDKLKIKQENQQLKKEQQLNNILLILFILASLFILVSYLLYRKNAKEKIQSQEKEIDKFNIEVLNLKLELEQKKGLLKSIELDTQLRDKLEYEIKLLNNELIRIKRNQLLCSNVGRKLTSLSQKHIPGNTKSLITKKMYEAIVREVKIVYPKFKSQVLDLCPNISDADWEYCCLILFNFDVKEESILLCVNPGTVRTRHLRIRQRLNIQLENGTLYDFFMKYYVSN